MSAAGTIDVLVNNAGVGVVALAIADAIESPDTNRRIPVGADAETVLG